MKELFKEAFLPPLCVIVLIVLVLLLSGCNPLVIPA